MADQNNDNTQITSVLDLSDEEIMNLDPASLASATPAAGEAEAAQAAAEQAAREAEEAAAAQAQEQQGQANADQGGNDGDDQGKAQGSADGAEAGQGVDGAKTAEQIAADAAAVDAAAAAKEAGKDSGNANKPATPAAPAPADGGLTELKSFQERILGKFKANGREMQVRDADEAIALMQKGAGFHKRMEQLKPNLAIVESLRKADLLSQDKIDFLIDVALKKPEAISKLVQESGIDPLDLTAEKAGGYKPTSHKVSEQEQMIDEVWTELEGAEGFDRTVNLVTKEWDKASQGIVASNPNLLRVITAQMQNGVYDLVAGEMHRERVLGRLTGLSDLEAYRQVGDAMEAAGKFKHLGKQAGQPAAQGQGAPAVPAVVKPDPKQAEDSNRNDKKRAASPARAAAAPAKSVVNPLAMSDEDILKLG